MIILAFKIHFTCKKFVLEHLISISDMDTFKLSYKEPDQSIISACRFWFPRVIEEELNYSVYLKVLDINPKIRIYMDLAGKMFLHLYTGHVNLYSNPSSVLYS